MNYIRAAAILGVIAMAYALYLGVDHNGYQRCMGEWDAERHQQAVAHLAAVEQNQKTINELEVKYAKSTADLEYLRAHPAGRVLLPPKTPCSSVPNPTDRVAVPTTGPERASDPAQDALGDAQSGMESDATEWSGALNACQVVMDWAVSLKTAGAR